MTESAQLETILFLDIDKKFQSEIDLQLGGRLSKPIFETSIDVVTGILNDPSRKLLGVFINPKHQQDKGVGAIKAVIQNRPNLPIFVITDEEGLEISEQDLKGLGVRGVFSKPVKLSSLLEAIDKAMLSFDMKAALEQAKTNTDKVDQETQASDANFSAILAANFISGSVCLFDVYVRITPGKYVKILQAGDSFQKDRLEGYLKKNVKNFYLRSEAQKHYLKYCDLIAQKVVKNINAPIESKVGFTLNHGQETYALMQKAGVTTESLKYTESFAENVHTLIGELARDNGDAFKNLIGNLAAYEHGVGVAMVAGLVGKELSFAAEKAVKIIGVAAMSHDLGLLELDPKLAEEDVSTMSEEELKSYKMHPQIGAEKLAAVRGIDPMVVQAVMQHHERRSRKGFPNMLGSGHISRIAEIVGISDEFLNLVRRAAKNPRVQPMEIMKTEIFNGFSNEVVVAFKKAFKL